MQRRIGRLPTPLEVVDTGADVVNQVFRTPARVIGNAAGAISQAAKNLEGDIARPADYSEIPPPPDVLVEPAVSGVAHIVEGVMSTARGAIDGVVDSANGVLREIRGLTRR